MATENEQSTATHPEEDRTSQPTGMIRKSSDRSLAKRQPGGTLAAPLSAYEMLRMTPFAIFRRMTEEFDRALQPFSSEDGAGANIAWVPTVEISERDGTYQILAELPGLSPKDVRVEVEDGALVIQGERKVEHERTEGGVRRSERQFGYFYRRIPLPEGANPEQAKAKFHDGMLEITVSAPGQKPERKQIPIEADSQPASGGSKQAA